MRTLKVALCIPVYGMCHAKFTQSLANMIIHSLGADLRGPEGEPVKLELETFMVSCSMLTESRHRLVAEALAWEADQMTRRLVPDFDSLASGNLTVTLYFRDHPESTAITKGPYTVSFDPGSLTTKVDFRASGKIMAVRIATGAGVWRLGKLLFDTVVLGER